MDKKRLPGKIRTMIIGAFTVGGIAVVVWAIFFFKPSVGDNKQRLTVRFADIESIDIGTRVTYAGRPAGEVIAINQILNARSKQPDSFGLPYSYEVILALDSSVKVYSTDLIEMHTSGLLGEKSIAIIPQPFPPGETPKLIMGGVIYAQSADPLVGTLKSVAEAAAEVTRTLGIVSEIIEDNKDQITSTIQNFSSTLEEVTNLVYQANQLDIVGSFNRAAIDISKMMNNTNQLVDQVRSSNIIDKVDSAATNLVYITEQISDGKGTLGKLINDPTIYLEAVGLIDRVSTLIYDLNNYGLLFHRNSRWKAAQRARIQAIDSLQTPDAFKKAFEEEMDQINQSLDKVSDMIEKAEMGDEEIVDSNEFKKYFYDLLNEVNRLQNLIELYNQKVTQPS
ncbi:MAG: hypothetical protein S4CHLAM6_07910 [Chlamydiae bacterium]|nr:hypothetical protein [Chlamydiota bacterium]